MNRDFEHIFISLALPFEPWELRVRQQGGRDLTYVTSRTVMNRLDEILGPENWWDTYVPGSNSVMCKLTVRLPDGSTVTKEDAGGYAGMSDQGDDDKSGFSDALKRAAAKFGVGRYLYGDGVPPFARPAFSEAKAQQDRPKQPPARVDPPKPERNGVPHRPIAPPAPAPAPEPTPEPTREPGDETQQVVTPERSTVGQRFKDRVLSRSTEVNYPGLLNAVAKWGQGQGFPTRIQDWSADQVSMAAARAKDLVLDHERAQINGRAKELAHS